MWGASMIPASEYPVYSRNMDSRSPIPPVGATLRNCPVPSHHHPHVRCMNQYPALMRVYPGNEMMPWPPVNNDVRRPVDWVNAGYGNGLMRFTKNVAENGFRRREMMQYEKQQEVLQKEIDARKIYAQSKLHWTETASVNETMDGAQFTIPDTDKLICWHMVASLGEGTAISFVAVGSSSLNGRRTGEFMGHVVPYLSYAYSRYTGSGMKTVMIMQEEISMRTFTSCGLRVRKIGQSSSITCPHLILLSQLEAESRRMPGTHSFKPVGTMSHLVLRVIGADLIIVAGDPLRMATIINVLMESMAKGKFRRLLIVNDNLEERHMAWFNKGELKKSFAVV